MDELSRNSVRVSSAVRETVNGEYDEIKYTKTL